MVETTAIERIQAHLETVSPGQECVITDAWSVGDGVWQGDLGLEIVAEIPADYVRVVKPTAADKQLVSGNTQGSRHVLDSLRGVELYRPRDWGKGESLQGPAFKLKSKRTVLHPTHGSVVIPVGFIVLCRYQRVWDQIQRMQRRNVD